ncbi:hypothetical protein OIU84_002181 [Salix udensis]|uniref:Uncharacterized protein n=1 Tax=Salix udensis TaxID=889485 RepID=A0AAD6K4A3_9ROSI|nr:hypothetical protein OIU84_002181 [Salix udensis]
MFVHIQYFVCSIFWFPFNSDFFSNEIYRIIF